MRVPHAWIVILLAMLPAAPAAAQGIVTSPRPDHVAVTVYRDPNRPAAQAPNLQWLNGVALISETRRITIPVGTTDIRFEGVAGGIIPQSAIVTGLPEGFIERNRDAYLLSPATLLARSLGQRVHLRRTSHATGQVREQEAVIRSGAGGGVVLQTEGGFEALRCTGLSETITYDGVPPGLSTRPTLSVRARATRPVTATVTVSYLATGFDWQADYVARVAPDGSIGLFAWLTLANSDETGFANADTQAVAGRIRRRDLPRQPSEGGPLAISCWPQSTTSDIPLEEWERMVSDDRDRFADGEGLVLTASRAMAPMAVPAPPPPGEAAMQAQQEELGDLKLYRIPEPVTVAARSQKQVALLQQPRVQVRTVYRQRFYPAGQVMRSLANRFFITRNRREDGLGLPLPAGRLTLFDEESGRQVLVGEAVMRDFALNEDVEIDFGTVPGITSVQTPIARGKDQLDYEVVVTNDRPNPVAYELEIAVQPAQVRSETRLGRRNGMALWSVNIPANGSVTLRYRVVSP
ncbi:DUF4139 domain-containing protein [Allosphingosinicella sp.]|uniref:DUF4139 domain-containing protein n=1 Tax=Allosphingosinicella sp. TaxID=2823234 RepID=UPI00378418BB